MRPFVAVLVAALTLASCAKTAPPAGRWEGAYQFKGTFIAARLEIAPNAEARISAPDVTDASIDNEADRVTMRQTIADRLAGSWGDVEPRPMDFDGSTFHKPGGIAPQIDWDRSSNVMTLYVYLGTQPAIRIPLHPVRDFSSDPWAH